MYMPLSEFSWSLDFMLGKNNPLPYHIDNLLLHLANVFLVFFLINKLTVTAIWLP